MKDVKDDHDLYYEDKERRNAECVPYLAAMILISFVIFIVSIVGSFLLKVLNG